MKKRILAWTVAVLLLAGAAIAEASLSRFEGKRIAVISGTMNDVIARNAIGEVQIGYYNTPIDAIAALRGGKADYWCTDEPIARFLLMENPDLSIVSAPLLKASLAAVFPRTEKGKALCDQYSAFVDGLWADGTMAVIDGIWFGADEEKWTMPDYGALPDTNGTLTMAADTTQRWRASWASWSAGSA